MKNEEKTVRVLPSLSKKNSQTKIRTLRHSCSSSFLQRNYVHYNDKMKMLRSTPTILSREDLNALLCKLKNYYNEVLSMNQAKEKKLEEFIKETDFLKFKTTQLLDFQDIDLPEERVSVKDFNDFKFSKEEIEEKIKALINEKNDLDYKFKNESEYSRTIEYMVEQEKDTLRKIHEKTKEIENKLETLRKYKKTIDANINERKKKKKNYEEVLKKINKDISLLEGIAKNEARKAFDIDNSIMQRESKNEEIKEYIKESQEKREIEFENYKEDLENKINAVNNKMEEKNEREKNSVRMILGFDLIQKFFINKGEVDLNEVIESKDYKDFTADKFSLLSDEDSKPLFSSNNFSESLGTKNSHRSQGISRAMTRLHSSSKPTNKFTRTFHSTDQKFYPKRVNSNKVSSSMFLSELKKKFDGINLKYDEMFEHCSNMNSKIISFRNILNNLNKKEINLETRKEEHLRKVKEIITKHYQSFKELISNNSRFQSFLEQHKSLIEAGKKASEEKKITQVNEKFTAFEVRENEENQVIFQKPIEEVSVEMYHKCHLVLRTIKAFLETTNKIFANENSCGKISPQLIQKCKKLNKDVSSFKPLKFERYLERLVNYSYDEGKSYPKDSLDFLIDPFFIDKEHVTPNSMFILQFLSKDCMIEEETLNFFQNISSEVVSTIAELAPFLVEKMNEIEQVTQRKRENDSSTGTFFNYTTKIITRRQSISNKENNESTKSVILNKNFASYQDEESDPESDYESTQSDVKVIKQKNRSSDQRIIQKLYEPSLYKTFYARSLNENMKIIKGMTSDSTKTNFALLKKREEINELSKQILLYNNPKINIEKISNSTYNSVLNYAFRARKNRRYKSRSYYE